MISTFRSLFARFRRHPLSVSALLAEPAGHRVTLRRPRLLGSPLVMRSAACASHADALQALKDQYKVVTGRQYLVQRGDVLTAENPPRKP